MPGVIDTNILLYAANSDSEEHHAAVRFLNEAGSGPDQWYFTEGIFYEFLRVSTHPRVFPSPLSWKQAMQFLNVFLSNANFQMITIEADHWLLLEKMLSEITYPSGNLFFDIRTAVLMKQHGIRIIYTTDTDFLQFSEIEVIDPLRQQY